MTPGKTEAVSVSALNHYVKTLLETDEVLSQVWVEGEISSLKIHQASGHIYFRVTDGRASVSAVMWRSNAQRLTFVPKDGMKAVFNCQVSLYEKDGSYQIYVRDILQKGLGQRQTELEQLKEKLEKEGLFRPERKRLLPRSPARVAVISSSSGAAIHDVESVTGRRDPFAELILLPANVQGPLAVEAIKRAIDLVNGTVEADVCIITRGGGSRDDLWLFNDESLVRKAATLRIPFISAVGHEIDTTLLDLVADVRAATPSSAAEIAVTDRHRELEYALQTVLSCRGALTGALRSRKELLEGLKEETDQAISSYVNAKRRELNRLEQLTAAASPLARLSNGYGYVTHNGEKVVSAASVKRGDLLEIRLSDGRIRSRAEEIDDGR